MEKDGIALVGGKVVRGGSAGGVGGGMDWAGEASLAPIIGQRRHPS